MRYIFNSSKAEEFDEEKKMNNYSIIQFKTMIANLLAIGHEGDYWDYKREWPSVEENSDLIKDIICFANTTHPRDCFLIIGADNQGKPHTMEKHRRNQNELNTLMSSPVWAGDNKPIVSLETVDIAGNIYDIVIIHNSDRTPYYLKQDYIPEIKYPPKATMDQKNDVNKKREKKTLRQGVIYVRHGDNSTGFGEIANPVAIEELWKKRFHLLLPIYNQFIEEMATPDNWDIIEGEMSYNIFRPEFTFRVKPTDFSNKFVEFYVKLFPDHNAYTMIYVCSYYATPIKEFYTISIDGGRWHIPYPKIGISPFIEQRYFYICENDDDKVIYNFLNSQNSYSSADYLRRFTEYVPCFKTEEEHQNFEQWLRERPEIYNEERNKNEKSEKLSFGSSNLKTDAIICKSLVVLLNKYRLSLSK